MNKLTILGMMATGLTVLGLTVLGCGDGQKFTSDGSDEVTELPLKDIPQELSAAACSTYLRCIPTWQILYGTQEECTETFSNQFAASRYEQLEDSIQQERVTYDGKKGQQCVTDLKNAACEDSDLRQIEACNDAFVGSAELGDDCTNNEECTGENVCLFESSCPGSCSPPLDAGELCGNDEQCEVGLVCSPENERCVAPAGEGDDCEAGEPPCQLHLICLGQDVDEGTSGTCLTPEDVLVGEEGDACNFLGDDISLCAEGLACQLEEVRTGDGVKSFCRAPVESGDECGVAFPSICPSGEYCSGLNADEGELTGTCRSAPGKGEACSNDPFFLCAPGLLCLEGTCTEPQHNGEPCSVDAECYSEHCDVDACAPLGGCE